MSRQPFPASDSIALPTAKGLLFISINQIIRIQSVSNYSRLYLLNGNTITVSKVLRWFQLNPQLAGFIRIHRTHLVNSTYINRCGVQSSPYIFLSNGEKLKIARRKKSEVIQHLIQCNSSAINKYLLPSIDLPQLKIA